MRRLVPLLAILLMAAWSAGPAAAQEVEDELHARVTAMSHVAASCDAAGH